MIASVVDLIGFVMHIDHAALYVEDLQKAKAFFERHFKVKCSLLYHNPKSQFSSYFLSFDEGSRLEIMNAPDKKLRTPHPKDQGFAHLAIGVGSKENVDSITKALVDEGYQCLSGPRVTGDGYYESCLAIFEGNILELTV